MAKDQAEIEMEKLLAKQRANQAANVPGGYTKRAVKAIRKGKSKRQKMYEDADPSYR